MPRGVKGSGKAATKRAAAALGARIGHEVEVERGTPAVDPNDTRPRCRVPLCGAVLEAGGVCPACTFRARKYAKLFVAMNPNCECGAPRRPKTPGALRMPKRCPLCQKLHAKAIAKGLT